MSDDIHGLFDLSGKSQKKKLQKSENIVQGSSPSNQETQAQLAKMKEMQANLTLQIEETMKKSGQDSATVAKFCQNPSNFTKEQWDKMQKRKEDLETTFSGLSKDALEAKKKKKAEVSANKERRGKTLGARKNWLDMR